MHGVEGEPQARQGLGHLHRHDQPAPVHPIGHGSPDQRPDQQRPELGQTHQPDLERRPGEQEHLVGHGHDRQL